MLLVEQNAARTIDFCDRCVVLSAGKVRAQGSRERAAAQPRCPARLSRQAAVNRTESEVITRSGDVDDQPREAPTSEEVSLALRRCWQPVARIEDLEQGPQRAVLLGEALAVFLTESGKAAVVADRCAHRGASLSMGKVARRVDPVPLPRLGVGRRGRRLHPHPLAGRPGQIPPRARIPAFPVREQWGLVWTVLEEPLGEPPSLPWFDPEKWLWGHGTPFELPVALRADDRELPRRLPFRLRPPGRRWARCRR